MSATARRCPGNEVLALLAIGCRSHYFDPYAIIIECNQCARIVVLHFDAGIGSMCHAA